MESEKKLDKMSEKNLKMISKIVGKILIGKGDDNDFVNLISGIMKYNVYNSIPDYKAELPQINITPKEGEENTMGSYLRYQDKLWINPSYFNISTLKQNPNELVHLFNVVSHEMRHWYQNHETYNKVESSMRELIMSGIGDVFFENAVSNLNEKETFSYEDILMLYRNVGLEEILDDFKMLNTDSADLNSGMGISTELGRYSEFADDDVNRARMGIAQVLNHAQYASQAKELDARLAGAIGSINLVSELKQSKNKEAVKWSSKIDITSLIQDAVDTEMGVEEGNEEGKEARLGNDELRDSYDNFLRNVSPERVVQMMSGIDNLEFLEKFNDNILNQKPQSQREKILINALARGIGKHFMPAHSNEPEGIKGIYSQIPKEKLKEMFSSGLTQNVKGDTIGLRPNGYKMIISLLGQELGQEEVLQKVQNLIDGEQYELAGDLIEEYQKQFSAVTDEDFENMQRFHDSSISIIESNKEKLFDAIRRGGNESYISNLLNNKFSGNFVKELYDVRLETLEKVNNWAIDGGHSTDGVRRSMGKLINDYVAIQKILQGAPDRLKEAGTQYFELAEKYNETITILFNSNLSHLSEEAAKSVQTESTDGKNDGAMVDKTLNDLSNLSDEEFLKEIKYLLEHCKAQNANLKEELSTIELEENENFEEEEAIEPPQIEEALTQEQLKEDKVNETGEEADKNIDDDFSADM